MHPANVFRASARREYDAQAVRSPLIARSTQHTQYAESGRVEDADAESLDRATVLTLMIRVDAGTGLLSVISVQVPENMANLQVL
ncbi:hypothetical protein CCHR01_01492 [Colletotrichum chrysophilum]|uniref:Uncharacterized protein n=1 Tax=Colletotrichum chrysophilum TaxID=1836956 RepID=A0AAD9AY14_9PEZI|nr:hypothetical protein CCHR01_01492 [Colletotrichum chrysophilum]